MGKGAVISWRVPPKQIVSVIDNTVLSIHAWQPEQGRTVQCPVGKEILHVNRFFGQSSCLAVLGKFFCCNSGAFEFGHVRTQAMLHLFLWSMQAKAFHALKFHMSAALGMETRPWSLV